MYTSILQNFLLYSSLLVLFTSCTVNGQEIEPKIKGISFVATREVTTPAMALPLIEYNANYVGVHPYGFMRDTINPQVLYNSERQWYGERIQGARQSIEMFQQQGLKVMLKPQIWIGRGIYTGTLRLNTEEQWKILEDSYEGFILSYAQLAQETNSEMFCIGTELESFVKARPKYWDDLIGKIKKVYKGPITYAGNWDSYKQVSFWDQMDFIGVDAYFPVSDEKTPSINSIKKGWLPWVEELESVSRKHKKKIIFTEYGYVSADYAGKEPWKNAGKDRNVNQQAQRNLLQGQYELIWPQEWFAGGFLWKHHAESSRRGYAKRFTPQGKLGQQTVTEMYQTNFNNKNR